MSLSRSVCTSAPATESVVPEPVLEKALKNLTVGKPGMLKSLQTALLVSSAQSRAARFSAGLQSLTSLASAFHVGAKAMQWPHQEAKNSTAQALLEPSTVLRTVSARSSVSGSEDE